jgi:hypothetical protein
LHNKAEAKTSVGSSCSNKQKENNDFIIHDHCYANNRCSDKCKIENSSLPEHVKNILPPSYTYKLNE